MNLISFILCILYIFNTHSIIAFKNNYLNSNQWRTIKKFIVNHKTNIKIIYKVNKILYFYYHNWSCRKALKFKKFYYNKCKHIPLIELYCYSNIGLIKAINNYDGKGNFTNYANIYINGELYRGLTELHPISIIPKKERCRKKNVSEINIFNKGKNFKTRFVGDNVWLYDKLEIKNNYYNYINYWDNNYVDYHYGDYYEFWQKTNLLEPFEKHLIHSKFDFNLNKKVSNNYLAKKLGYSEEYIRVKIKNALQLLKI